MVDTFKTSSRGSGALFGQKAIDSFLQQISFSVIVPTINDNTFKNIKVLDDNERIISLHFNRKVGNIEFSNNTFEDMETRYEDFSIRIIKEESTKTSINYKDCKFKNYKQGTRGHFSATDQTKTNIDVTYELCQFEFNEGDGDGGCLHLKLKGSCSIKDSNFKHNTASNAGRGGGIYVEEVTNIEVENCIFEDDTSNNNGGSIFISSTVPSTSITSCKFNNCKSTSTDSAYTISVTSKRVLIESSNVTFDDNTNSCGGIDLGNQAFTLINCNFVKTSSKGSILFTQSNMHQQTQSQ